jgi:hypothetical protein
MPRCVCMMTHPVPSHTPMATCKGHQVVLPGTVADAALRQPCITDSEQTVLPLSWQHQPSEQCATESPALSAHSSTAAHACSPASLHGTNTSVQAVTVLLYVRHFNVLGIDHHN